jgi:hypothetical protein
MKKFFVLKARRRSQMYANYPTLIGQSKNAQKGPEIQSNIFLQMKHELVL